MRLCQNTIDRSVLCLEAFLSLSREGVSSVMLSSLERIALDFKNFPTSPRSSECQYKCQRESLSATGISNAPPTSGHEDI